MSNVNDLLQQAIDETTHLNSGEEFLVRDLFKGYEWKRIPLSVRLLLGTLFLHHVDQSDGDIEATEKTSSNQQQYRKREARR